MIWLGLALVVVLQLVVLWRVHALDQRIKWAAKATAVIQAERDAARRDAAAANQQTAGEGLQALRAMIAGRPDRRARRASDTAARRQRRQQERERTDAASTQPPVG